MENPNNNSSAETIKVDIIELATMGSSDVLYVRTRNENISRLSRDYLFSFGKQRVKNRSPIAFPARRK